MLSRRDESVETFNSLSGSGFTRFKTTLPLVRPDRARPPLHPRRNHLATRSDTLDAGKIDTLRRSYRSETIHPPRPARWPSRAGAAGSLSERPTIASLLD
jgi:hypothetical protein